MPENIRKLPKRQWLKGTKSSVGRVNVCLKKRSRQPGTQVAAMHCHLQISMYHNWILRVQINDSFRQLETPQFECKKIHPHITHTNTNK
jgi:hypothetical protein